MKNISVALLNFLQTTDNFNRADLILIELVNGQVIAATTAQVPVTFQYSGSSPAMSGPHTYYPTLYGAWERGKVTSKVSYAPKANTMDLTVVADITVTVPVGSGAVPVPLVCLVSLGLFDAALVTVYTIYWAIGSTPAAGVSAYGGIVTFLGKIANFAPAGRSKTKFQVADMLYLLNYDTPPNLLQSGCRFQLFDQGCTLLQSSFGLANTVAAGSNNFFLNLGSNVNTASFWNAFMTFTQGTILFTSGLNAGLRYYIKAEVDSSGNMIAPGASCTRLQLGRPLVFPAMTGDTFTMYPGCAKTLSACRDQFNNLIHIGSTLFTPNPEQAL